MNVDPEVHKAVLLRHAHLNPDRGGEISEDEYRTSEADVLARKAAIENEAVQLLHSKLREGRRIPRRHMRFALALIAVLVFLISAIIFLGSFA